jgi:hypothetical protein
MGLRPFNLVGYDLSSTSKESLHQVSFEDSQTKSTIINVATTEEIRQNDDWFAAEGGEKRYV